MKVCNLCRRQKELTEFTVGRAVCKRCRADVKTEQARLAREEAAAADHEEAHRRWAERRIDQWKAENARRRGDGRPELPRPYVADDWLERLRARAAGEEVDDSG